MLDLCLDVHTFLNASIILIAFTVNTTVVLIIPLFPIASFIGLDLG
jgi:hypothetical protein